MSNDKNNFRHDSLQDRKSIQQMLKSISKGIAKGELLLSDDEGEICLEPDGLLNVKVSARQQDNQNRLSIRISWVSDDEQIEQKPIRINGD